MSKPRRFVDAHIHLWDLSSGWYPNLEARTPTENEQGVGDYSRLQGRNYLLQDYFSDVTGVEAVKLVHVTAASKPPAWPEETRWLQNLFQKSGFPNAIIGWANLTRPLAEIEKELSEHAESPNFRGIRNHEGIDFESSHTEKAFAVMERLGLLYDVVAHDDSLPTAAALAAKFADMSFVLEHTGWPRAFDADTFDLWRQGMRRFADVDNTSCKISGLGMVMHRWTVEDLRPWIEAAIEIFGTDRCMFATNFPVDSLYSTYGKLIEAYSEITSGWSEEERERLFAGNAERIYRI